MRHYSIAFVGLGYDPIVNKIGEGYKIGDGKA